MNKDRFRIGKTFISITTPQLAEEKISKAIIDGLNTYICVSDPRTVDFSYKDAAYRDVMNNSFMNTPDGQPIMWAAGLWGLKQAKRTMGPLLFQSMITNPSSGIKHYLLGDTEETLSRIVEKCKSSNSLIVGTFSPPFCSLDEYDYKGIAKMINESQADIVWIAMRAPKQDYFSVRILPYLDKKICIGVGAAFRFFLGEYRLAPKIIRKLGLMGLWWGRKNQKMIPFIWGYLKDNMPFFLLLMQIPIRRLFGKKYYE